MQSQAVPSQALQSQAVQSQAEAVQSQAGQRTMEVLTKLDTLLKGAAEQKKALENLQKEVSTSRLARAAPEEGLAAHIPHGRGHTAETSGFEMCLAHRTSPRVLAQTSRREQYSPECDPTSASRAIPIYNHGWDGSYRVACCEQDGLHCGGCEDVAENAGFPGSCRTCAGGFVQLEDGRCQACMDMVSWESADGVSCFDLDDSCTDEKVNGISASEACCKCGGGHRAATAFGYYVGAVVIGTSAYLGLCRRLEAQRFIQMSCGGSVFSLVLGEWLSGSLDSLMSLELS